MNLHSTVYTHTADLVFVGTQYSQDQGNTQLQIKLLFSWQQKEKLAADTSLP
jgi:hypothetical protein